MRWIRAALVIWAPLAAAAASCGEDAPEAPPAPAATPETAAAPKGDPGQPVRCPVCDLEFRSDEAAGTHVHEGRTYHFLIDDHRRAFAAEPGRYLTASPPLLSNSPSSK